VKLPKSGPTPDARYEQPSSVAAFAAITPKSSNPLVASKSRKQAVPTDEVASIAPAYAEGEGDGEPVDTVTTASTAKPSKLAKAEKAEKIPSGWSIQVGVSPSKEMANDLLDTVKSKGGKVLRSAKPYTVAFGNGGSQVYRARFGGFDDQREAVNACKALKKAGVKCWASME
jgi:D-alanyl-D-alanine carboxypeptidase